KTITWSALSTSPAPAATAPSYPTSSVSFTAGGSATILTAVAYAAGANTLTANDSGGSAGSASLTVSPATVNRLVVSPSTSTPTAATSFTPPLNPHDLYAFPTRRSSDLKTITWSALSTSPAPAATAPSYPTSSVSFT